MLVGIFLLTTIGITTYKHYCHADGTFTSIYIPNTHECADHQEEQHACCKPKTVAEKENCCQDEVNSYKIQSEYKLELPQQIDFDLATLLPLKWLFVIIDHFFCSSKLAATQAITPIDPPPHLSGGISYLQFLRIWRL